LRGMKFAYAESTNRVSTSANVSNVGMSAGANTVLFISITLYVS